MCGYTTTSRSGSTGIWVTGRSGVDSASSVTGYPLHCRSQWGARPLRYSWGPPEDCNGSPPPQPRGWAASGVANATGPEGLLDGLRSPFLGDIDDVGLGRALDHRFVDDDLDDIAERGQLVHGIEQDILEDRAQAARAGLALHGPVRHRTQGLLAELEFRALHVEELAILLGERVARLGEDDHQCGFIQLIERRHHGEPPDKLRNQAVLDQVLGLDLMEQVRSVGFLVDAAHLGSEADAALMAPVQDDLLEAREGAAADKQDVRGVDLQEFLQGVLAPALGRNGRDRALDELQERLRHALC